MKYADDTAQKGPLQGINNVEENEEADEIVDYLFFRLSQGPSKTQSPINAIINTKLSVVEKLTETV